MPRTGEQGLKFRHKFLVCPNSEKELQQMNETFYGGVRNVHIKTGTISSMCCDLGRFAICWSAG
jgi:hypothetical protein